MSVTWQPNKVTQVTAETWLPGPLLWRTTPLGNFQTDESGMGWTCASGLFRREPVAISPHPHPGQGGAAWCPPADGEDPRSGGEDGARGVGERPFG